MSPYDLLMTEVNPVKELCFGAVSGVFGKVIEYPFDTIKVRLQSSQVSLSTTDLIVATYKNEGIFKGFYQGIRAPLVGACLENAILFTSYNTCLTWFPESEDQENRHHAEASVSTTSPPLIYKCLSGGFAGFMASFMLTPIELIKCQLQVKNISDQSHNPAKAHSNLYSSVVKDIIRSSGVLGLWKGLGSTLLREVNGTAIWFGSYELLTDKIGESSLIPNNVNSLISGALAGATFNLLTFPVDTIKSNIQTNDVLKNHGKDSNLSYLSIIKSLGIRRLYSGLSITLIRSLPANAMIFYSYEWLKHHF